MPFLPSCVTTTDLFEEKPGWILSKFVCKYPVSEECFRGRRDEMIMQLEAAAAHFNFMHIDTLC